MIIAKPRDGPEELLVKLFINTLDLKKRGSYYDCF